MWDIVFQQLEQVGSHNHVAKTFREVETKLTFF
jgi:hypothetical protein